MKATTPLPAEFLERVADTVKIIGHPLRLQILDYLDRHGASPVGAIAEGVGGAQAAVSQHLNKMRLAGVVAARRVGRQVHYGQLSPSARTLLGCMRRQFAARRSATPAPNGAERGPGRT